MSGETFTNITVQGTANHTALSVIGETTLNDLYITGTIFYDLPPISTTHNILTVLTTSDNAQSLPANTPVTLLWSTVPAVPTYPAENTLGIPGLTYNNTTGSFTNSGTINKILTLQASIVFSAPGTGQGQGFRTISFLQASATPCGGKQQAYLIVPAAISLATMATIELAPGDSFVVQATNSSSNALTTPPSGSDNILTIIQQ